MRIEIIRAPTESFVEMLVDNIRPAERKRLEGQHWGAIGLVQSRLIDLYWAADVAEKASDVVTALVMGNCPQHTQMLASRWSRGRGSDGSGSNQAEKRKLESRALKSVPTMTNMKPSVVSRLSPDRRAPDL